MPVLDKMVKKAGIRTLKLLVLPSSLPSPPHTNKGALFSGVMGVTKGWLNLRINY